MKNLSSIVYQNQQFSVRNKLRSFCRIYTLIKIIRKSALNIPQNIRLHPLLDITIHLQSIRRFKKIQLKKGVTLWRRIEKP